jgi:hypothetical protein
VGAYFAGFRALSDGEKYQSDDIGCVLVFSRQALETAGYELAELDYRADDLWAWEQEIACWDDIDVDNGLLMAVQVIPDAGDRCGFPVPVTQVQLRPAMSANWSITALARIAGSAVLPLQKIERSGNADFCRVASDLEDGQGMRKWDPATEFPKIACRLGLKSPHESRCCGRVPLAATGGSNATSV